MRYVRCYKITLTLVCLMVDLSLAQSCGKRKVVNFLIVNGTEANDGDWPWHAAIYHNYGRTSVYKCGGTILDRNTVLTAAHCVMTPYGVIAKRRLTVQVGRIQLTVASKRVQEHAAFELIIHPEFNVNGIQHDIALVMLDTDITYNNYIQPVCLWNRGEDLNAIVGSWGTVIGFGIDETNDVSDTLREATIPVVSHITCIESNREVFANQLTSNMFCAGNHDGISACNGDSGGGLYFNYNDVWYIRGLVSFTQPRRGTASICDTKEYTVFTDVAKYLDWIEQQIRRTDVQPDVTVDNNSHKTMVEPMSNCGVISYVDKEESSRPVLLGYPWLGLVECTEKASGENETLCHGTLISDLYLIVGANCVSNIEMQCITSSVRLGEYDKNTKTNCTEMDGKIVCLPLVQTIRIQSVITHKAYNPFVQANDIALIRLQDRADTSRGNVKPICLPVTSELRRQKSSYYLLTAWDYLTYEKLLERSLREVVEATECQKLLKDSRDLLEITPHQICIKHQHGPQCKLSWHGTPLQLVQQVQGESRYVLYGVYSLGEKWCDSPYPDVYTNVASYMDWIQENIQK